MTLSEIALSYPHEAFAAFTHGFSSRWTYLSRFIPDIAHLLQPLEKIIHQHFIHTLMGRSTCSDAERLLFPFQPNLVDLA
jgi:hypothetical protein